MTYPMADAATSTSAPTNAPVKRDPCTSPGQDRGPATQDPPSGADATVRKHPTRMAFIGTSDYRNSAGSSQDDGLKPMDSIEDIRRIYDLIQSFPIVPKESFRCALNDRFTRSNLVNRLTELRRLLGPRFYYLGGHADWCGERREFDYLFGHNAKSGNVNHAAQRISATELGALLVDPTSPIPVQMILITDFCNSFNFLRLPWVLQGTADGKFFWERSEDYVPGVWNDDHKILQFASGEKGAITYSFGSCGSIFTREFYNAEHTGEGSAKAPVSLSKRMSLIRDGMNTFIAAYNSKNSLAIRQIPQAYASHPFDLDCPSTLPDLLRRL
ncbi:hypothetical protein FRC06_004692 [Ceratobasidium sp. 370]|nr:hypothetical protein FRC06_004692 [Ceratobasidium sp. 370]